MLESYLLFLFKLITCFIFFFILLMSIMISVGLLKSRKKDLEKGSLKVRKISSRLDNYEIEFNRVLMEDDEYREYLASKDKSQTLSFYEKIKLKFKREASSVKSDTKENSKSRLFVIDFKGDMQASAVESFKEEITAILVIAKDNDRVFVRLESAGGLVHQYGFAASQIARLREKGLYCIVSIDRVAASGGYLMACVANEIVAAPFSVIGSIGVIAQIPNFYKLLKKNHIDFEQHTAGKYKRTLTLFGQNTDEGREKFVEDLDVVHDLFKNFIKEYRPQVNVEEVATGEIWYGKEAINHNLVDSIQVGDSYLQNQKIVESYDIFEVKWKYPVSLINKFFDQSALFIENLFFKLVDKDKKQKILL